MSGYESWLLWRNCGKMCGSCGIHCGSTVSSASVLCLCCPEVSSGTSVGTPITLEQILSCNITRCLKQDMLRILFGYGILTNTQTRLFADQQSQRCRLVGDTAALYLGGAML